MNGEWWMMNDELWILNGEWWMVNDEWWMMNDADSYADANADVGGNILCYDSKLQFLENVNFLKNGIC